MEKRLAWQPQEVVDKTLFNTTQHYLRVECESRLDPRGHIKTRTPGLRQKRLSETVATDTLFPSIRFDWGNCVLQFFIGCTSNNGKYIH